MKKFRIERQIVFFNSNNVPDWNDIKARTQSELIEADSYEEIRDNVEVTADNIQIVKDLKLDLQIGQYYLGPLIGLKFIKEDSEEKIIELSPLGDPLFALYEEGKAKPLLKHVCKG